MVWAQRLTAESGAKAPRCSADPVEFPGSWEIWASSGKRGCGSTNWAWYFPSLSHCPSSEHLENPSLPLLHDHTYTPTPHTAQSHSAHTAGCTLHAVCLPGKHTFPPPRGSPRPHLLVFPRKKKNNLKCLKIELIIMKVFFCCPILIMNKIFMNKNSSN